MKQIITLIADKSIHTLDTIRFLCIAIMVIFSAKESKTYANIGDIIGIGVDKGMCYNIISDGTATLFGNLEDYGGDPDFSGPYVIPQHITYNGEEYEVDCINGAFANVKGLTAIVIPPSVVQVATSFSYCPNLTSIIFMDGEKPCTLTYGNYYGSKNSNVEYLYVGRPLSRYNGTYKDLVGNTIKFIQIGNINCTSIGEGARVKDFRGCENLETIVIDGYISDSYFDVFSDSYFSDLKNLESVIFTENSRLKTVPSFTGCTSLKYLNVPSSVTYCPAGALRSSPKGSRMVCYATTPPSLSDVIFNYQNYTYYGAIYVPSYAKDTYKSTSVWKDQLIYSIPESQDIVFDTESINLTTGESTNIYPTQSINDILGGIWRSSDNSVAIVNNGTITAVGKGECYITLQSGNNLSNQVKVSVTDFVPVEAINFNTDSVRLLPKETYKLYAQVSPSDASTQTLKWTTSSMCVSINQNGEIMAKYPGEAIIKATATDGSGVYAECTVEVTDYAGIADITTDGVYITTDPLVATVHGANADTVIRLFDMDGKTLYIGNNPRVEVTQPGFYILVVNAKTYYIKL